ncbi:MAG TPA: hypothetical protein VF161_11740 [Steroidobacteraceae bacterium]
MLRQQKTSICASVPAMLLLVIGQGVSAQDRASEAMNFELGIATRDLDTEDSTSSGDLGVRGAATIPLGSWLFASFKAGYSESTVRTRDVLAHAGGLESGVRPSCGFDSLNGSAGLFVRRPRFGKIGVSYLHGELSADCGTGSQFVSNAEEDLTTDGYRVDAEVYLGNFTLAGARFSTDLDSSDKLETTSVSASWYAMNNLKLSVYGDDLNDRDTYGVLIEHQPDFMGDALGVYVGYATTDDDLPRTRTISFGISYYFGTRVDLKTRDRQYR